MNLAFNLDGTIDPAQLEGMPQEFIDRVTSPEFVAQAREQIARQRSADRFKQDAAWIRAEACRQHELRRPSGVSGRQRKRLRRAARKLAKAGTCGNLQSESGGQRK